MYIYIYIYISTLNNYHITDQQKIQMATPPNKDF